eukprot:4559616-Pleurochrysis_carterae.AAC.1
MGAGRVNGEAPLSVGRISLRDVTMASLYTPFEQPPRSTERALTESSESEKLGAHLTHALASFVRCSDWQITDEGTTLGATVNAHNAIFTFPHVYEIRCMRMDMPRASAIYNETDAATSIAQ